MNHHPGERVHLELRRTSFVLYTDHAKERMELLYADADEVVEQLTKVVMSEHYQLAKRLPPTRSATGHLLDDTPQKLRPKSARRRLHFICDCGAKVSSQMRDITVRDMGKPMCRDCYASARSKLYPPSQGGRGAQQEDPR